MKKIYCPFCGVYYDEELCSSNEEYEKEREVCLFKTENGCGEIYGLRPYTAISFYCPNGHELVAEKFYYEKVDK